MSTKHNNPNPARHHEWYAPDGKVYELVDLPHKTTRILMPTEADREGAIPLDPNNCALARCASREASGLPAMVGADKAYIPSMLNGEWQMNRCKVPKDTRIARDLFDRTGVFPPGGFRIVGIPPSEEIDSERARKKRSRERSFGREKGEPPKPRKQPLRNAQRRAQVFVREEIVEETP